MPDHTRQDFPEYSFDEHTLVCFSQEKGVTLPKGSSKEIALWIEENTRDLFSDWKSEVVTDLLRRVKISCQAIKPDIQIMLNTIPFRAQDFDNARKKVFGQDVESLSKGNWSPPSSRRLSCEEVYVWNYDNFK